jgi:hypothetical protein
MTVKTGLKKTLIYAILFTIVGLLTIGSGMLAKLFIKANSCHQTKLLLFVSGVLVVAFIFGLGALVNKYDTEKKFDQYMIDVKAWANKEQYRYQNLGGGLATGSTLV